MTGAPRKFCRICGWTDATPSAAPIYLDRVVHWTMPGTLCTACAGEGFAWSPCPNCRCAIVWAFTEADHLMMVDPIPPQGQKPALLLFYLGGKMRARAASPEFIAEELQRRPELRSGVCHFPNCPNPRGGKKRMIKPHDRRK